ncbi:MAG: hypothetical protein CHACPFDD_02412 [Phycisphaerae bacterium]|nr:hypothetical protein [Phycisphaerae bacterium]
MRILILQFVPDVRGRPLPRFEPQLGTLGALLRLRDHELGLIALTRYDQAALKAALARYLPQLIYADVSAVCIDAARRTLQYVAEHEFVPVVAGGQFPTVDPSAALSLPAVQAVAIGEPDASLVTYLERMKDPAVGQVVSGVWLRDEQGLARPDLPALVEDLDSLPFPERDLFNYADVVRQTGQIEIAVGRGCPQSCAYCINDWVESLYEEKGSWTRRRSPGNIVDEIDLLRNRYVGTRSVRFLDHAFALDRTWIEAFLPAYRAEIDLPFRCHLRANALDADLARHLAQAGCRWADVELVSGSDFVRNEIFDMELSGEQIDASMSALHAAGISARVVVYLGSPYESEASLDETVALLARLKPASVDVRTYFPWPGTRAAETARDHGWIHPRGEEQYHRGQCGINMPACRPDVVAAYVRRLQHEFPAAVGEPWWRRWTHFGR